VKLLTLPSWTVVVHGACKTGVDDMVDESSTTLGLRQDRFPAPWRELGRRAGMVRNGDMVNSGGDYAIAWPSPNGSGTQGFCKLAARAQIPLEVRSIVGDIAAMRRHLFAILTVVSLAGTPACGTGALATLAKVATVISETSQVLAIAENVWELYSQTQKPSPEEQAKFSALITDAWRALNAASAAVRGAEHLNQQQYDAAFAEFRKSYGTLHEFLVARGVVGVPGAVGGGEQLPEPAALNFKVE